MCNPEQFYPSVVSTLGPMTPERWQRIKEIVQGALARPATDRAAWVAEACGEDVEIASEVDSLIKADAQAGTFIEAPALARAGMAAVFNQLQEPPTWAGRRVGPYVLVRELGHGGMGAVYLAVRADDEYRKQVAIKVIQSSFDQAFIQQRFRHERQILAGLDHPNIARLIDGGSTADGAPYFVMEYVDGLPLDQYCDVNQLSIEARLVLFLQVCAAVHYAHQHLVVHRDLKAGNVLVAADGQPKLLDFGIAKLLDAETDASIDRTATALRVMTLESASPEQVRGGAVTTATDVYALGVMLHRLLTGRGPYDLATTTPHDLAREICETDPRRPSDVAATTEIARRLRGDLDTIVLKALQKNPARRYGAVDEFAQDVTRHLGHRPVLARADAIGYRATKFVRRHAGGVAAAALIAVSLIGGLVATAWQVQVTRLERGRAERRFNDVRRLANSFLFEFHDAIQYLPGSIKARELVVRRALEYLDSLSSESSNDASLQRELAAAYDKVGDVQGLPGFANLGDTAGAVRSHQQALALRQTIAGAHLSDSAVRLELVTTYNHLSSLDLVMGNMPAALDHARQGFAVRKDLLAGNPNGVAERRSLGVGHHQLGEIMSQMGDWGAALDNFQQAGRAFEALLASDPANGGLQHNVALEHKKIGAVLERNGDPAAALVSYRKAAAIDEVRARANPNDTMAQLDLSYSYASIGFTLSKAGDTAAALSNYEQALSLRERVSAADPHDVNARNAVVRAHLSIGFVLVNAGRVREGIQHDRRALAIASAVEKPEPGQLANVYAALGGASAKLASTARDRGDAILHWRDARAWSRKSLDLRTEKRSKGTLSATDRNDLDTLTELMATYEAALTALDHPRAPVR
jgi:tetratricopeptide (TPR) repeat protein/tRNA A-37 threonylcarbamoyl transferase component Bud32